MRLTLFVLGFQFWATLALADWEWTSASDVNLYSEPSKNATVIKSLKGGEMVLITKLQKAKSATEEWVSFTLVEAAQKPKVYITKKELGEGEIKNSKIKDDLKTASFLKNFGIGLNLGQTIRGPISKDASGGQTVEYGPQYGIAVFPTLHYEIPAAKGNVYRFFASYRISKSQGESAIRQNGVLTSQELVTQTMNFMAVGILYRERSTAKTNYWWGYGAEIAKAISGKQEYTDGTSVDLKDSLPTNIYLQGSLGYQAYPPKSSQWMPEAKVGVIINNKPVTINGELIINWVKTL